MFAMAALSGDENMMSALTTPGKDLHDQTALRAFNITMYAPDGRVVSEDELVELAKKDLKAFEDFQKTLTYVDQRGRRLTRKAFKDGIRVSSKSLNFGTRINRANFMICATQKVCRSKTAELSGKPYSRSRAIRTEGRHEPRGGQGQSTGAAETITPPRGRGIAPAMKRCAGPAVMQGSRITTLDKFVIPCV